MVGGACDADTEAEVDFPLGRHIQIDGGKNLVLLEAGGQKVRGGAYGAVVFKAAGDFFREDIADFCVGRKNEALADRFAMEGTIESGIEIEIPVAKLLVDDGAHLPCPGIGGKLAALIADFVGEAEADGPLPFFRDGHAGTDMVTDPLNALAAALRGEDIEADLKPIGEAMSDFDGFVLGVVGGIEAIGDSLGAADSEIAVELDHGVVGLDEVVAIDLDFVVFLGACGLKVEKEQSREQEKPANRECCTHQRASDHSQNETSAICMMPQSEYRECKFSSRFPIATGCSRNVHVLETCVIDDAFR